MLEVKKEAKLVAGTRQVQRLIAAGRASRVLIAQDADARLRQTLRTLAETAGVPAEDCESMALLGRRCRIAVPCAAAAEEKGE
ncbi:MAG: ribosomal L7Ae/L30e/S12e/Gadd45 family protein [Clostridia bacterium]|nr:ribosomal L7Ae/L30e/S12e/Gadd45 family protein [Clostridia bacterium]